VRAALLLAAGTLALAACAERERPDLGRQVVTLSVTYQAFDEDRPWAKYTPQYREAFAVVVEGNLLLTLAQMTADATLIQVERRDDARRWNARVVHSDPEVNLALLGVDEPEFFHGLEQARFARWLPTGGSVQSVRWRNRQLEISTSRVAHVEVATSRYGNLEHAFLQVQTDITAGGWSEPVFRDGELIGLTSSQEEDQSAAITPVEVLRAYVTGARSGAYRGFASLGLVWQQNRDEALAAFLGLEGPPRGVVVRGVRTGASSCGVLRPRDVLLELDGHAIDAVGHYEHPRYGRIEFSHIAVEDHQPGDVVPARVLREGRLLDLEIELAAYPSELRLVPSLREGMPPAYLVAGGLVFRELDAAYLQTWGATWLDTAPHALTWRYALQAHAQTPERRRILVLTSVLPDAYNLGYHDLSDVVVERVNGRQVDSIGALEEAFAQPLDGYQVVELAPNLRRTQIVLDAADFEVASERIRTAYQIPEAGRRAAHPPIPLGTVCPSGF
jgi:S1-C subfamily serine protease